MYILTLGSVPSFRRRGLASNMMNKCLEYSQLNPLCSAVYLHVIHYNRQAISFYNKHNFEYIKTRYSYYEIDREWYSAFVYAFFINGYKKKEGLIDIIVTNITNILKSIFDVNNLSSVSQVLSKTVTMFAPNTYINMLKNKQKKSSILSPVNAIEVVHPSINLAEDNL